MEVKDIRLANLLALADGYKTADQFCERINMSPSYFSRLKKGKNIGDKIARNIENSLSLPKGYLDTSKEFSGKSGTSNQGIPAEVLGLAYAIETLPKVIRDSLSRLIYNLAADQSARADRPGDDVEITSFDMRIKQGGESNSIPEAEDTRQANGSD